MSPDKQHVQQVMLDPVSRSIAKAPIEDGEISEYEEKSVAEAREWLKRNKPIPHEEILAEFVLKPKEYPWNLGELQSAPH